MQFFSIFFLFGLMGVLAFPENGDQAGENQLEMLNMMQNYYDKLASEQEKRADWTTNFFWVLRSGLEIVREKLERAERRITPNFQPW